MKRTFLIVFSLFAQAMAFAPVHKKTGTTTQLDLKRRDLMIMTGILGLTAVPGITNTGSGSSTSMASITLLTPWTALLDCIGIYV
jgi:alkylated DNA repair dioxygenase AlkB